MANFIKAGVCMYQKDELVGGHDAFFSADMIAFIDVSTDNAGTYEIELKPQFKELYASKHREDISFAFFINVDTSEELWALLTANEPQQPVGM